MNYIPDLVPFNLIKEEVIDYKTVFPNRENTQKEVNSTRWRQVIPTDVEVAFLVWCDVTPVLTCDCSQSITEITTDSDYRLWRIGLTFTTEGEYSFTLNLDGDDYNSNTFNVLESLYDEVNQYHLVEYSNYKNDFDYWFDEYFKIWVQSESIDSDVTSSIESYDGDGNDTELSYGVAGDAISYTVPSVDRWFARVLNHINVCSLIRFDGIDYSPESEISIDRAENYINSFNVEISLIEKK